MPSSGRRLPLWFRIGGLLTLVIAFVIGLLSFLNYANFRKTQHALLETRYTVLGADARQTVELAFALGLAPSENERLAAVFKQLQSKWPAIRFAGVVDTEGKLLTGSGNFGAGDAASWQKRIADSKLDGIWRTHTEQGDVIGLTIADNFGGKAGAVVIAYDNREIQSASAAMAQELWLRSLAVLLAAAVLAWFGTWWLTRELATELDDAERLLQADIDTPPPAAQADDPTLVAETRAFVLAAHTAARNLQEGRT